METNNMLVVLGMILMLLVGALGAMALTPTEVVETEKVVTQEKLVEKECPVCPQINMSELECSGVETENELLQEYLEREFSEEYSEIEDNAINYSMEELEDDNYYVVRKHLEDMFDKEVMEDIEVTVDDTEVEVTNLGLKEDEDKSAKVVFDLKVRYMFEEGEMIDYRKSFVVEYEVVFDEGDFNDEEVQLVLIE